MVRRIIVHSDNQKSYSKTRGKETQTELKKNN